MNTGWLTFEWGSLLLMGALLCIPLAGAQWIKIKTNVKTEYTRKLVHFAAGCIVCLFPFVFDYIGSVLLMTLVFTGIMGISQLTGRLPSLHDIDRESAGAFLYPLAVLLIFYLSGGDWLYFIVPMLLLTIPDAAAALIGKEYGAIMYSVNKQIRTLEGSTIFFLISFIVVLIPLLLSHRVENETAILVAFLLALIITGIESVSVMGIDNLVIPVLGYIGIFNLIQRTNEQLILSATVLILAFVIMILINRRKQFTVSGIISMSLMLYAIYAWGGWYWMIPAVWYFFTFNLGVKLTGFNRRAIPFLSVEKSKGLFEVSAVFHISAVPLAILLINFHYPRPVWYDLFVLLIGTATVISYFHFIPYALKKLNISWIPKGSKRSNALRLVASLSGGLIVYGLAAATGFSTQFGILLQLAVGVFAIGLLIALHRGVIARYKCPQCGRTVFTPVHCNTETKQVSGFRAVGLWQGTLIIMLTVAVVFYYLP